MICGTCHGVPAEELDRSVHKALGCQSCHGGEASYSVAPEELSGYTRRAGGSAMTFDHGSSFSGRPTRAEIPDACGTCHADVERMNPYGLRTDQLARYWTSGHGKTLKSTGDQRVAVCVDCHGNHGILPQEEPASRTNVFNVPDTCATCHSDEALMGEFDLPVQVVTEYRDSVHGMLLYGQGDSGAPTCATCHGNHSAIPPGFAVVGAVCGKCHQHAEAMFADSAHAGQEGNKGCVQCHGGGEDRHSHLIERIMRPPGIMIQRYGRLMNSELDPTAEQVTQAIHPDPREIMMRALPTCMECHEDLDEDESLPKLFAILDSIADAEREYVRTAWRLGQAGSGVLLVDNQRFLLEDAKTLLIELAPIQHALDHDSVAEKTSELKAVCDQVNTQLDELEAGLRWRYRALTPIWVFSVVFSMVLYAKYKQLKRVWVKPLPKELRDSTRT